MPSQSSAPARLQSSAPPPVLTSVACTRATWPGAVLGTFEGEVEGQILDAPRGEGTFGYDPLFLVPELGKTLAELPPTEKNRLSHRARALERAKPALLELL